MSKKNLITRNGINIGSNSETLINVLLGFNSLTELDEEYNKLHELNANRPEVGMITDLSMCDVTVKDKLWKRVLDETRFIAGTVPIYLAKRENHLIEENKLLEIIQQQSEEGVSIITIHPTVDRELIDSSKTRLIPITSRGGGIAARDLILSNNIDNVYIRILDSIVKIAKANNTIISIGSSFRSATIIDSFDNTYKMELGKQFEIADYLSKNEVQVILETPGHADPRSIHAICGILKKNQYPIMPLGPMPTDIAYSKDDTAAAIGAVLMGTNDCADVLSIVTKEEHTGGIPTMESLLNALNQYKVAKHIIDIYKLGIIEEDYKISYERSHNRSCLSNNNNCERCGEECPLKLLM